MVARGFWNAPTLLNRWQGCVVGLIAAVPPAAMAPALLGLSAWSSSTLTIACLASGAVIGSTIGRGLAARPSLVGVVTVAAIAVAVGDLIAVVLYPLGVDHIAPLGDYLVGWIVLAPFGCILFALPGLILGIHLARWSWPGRA